MKPRATKGKGKAKAPKEEAITVEIPPWPDIAVEELRDLAQKLNKAKDSYRVSDLICKVNGDDWGSRHAIAWHLVACRAVQAEANPNVLDFLSEGSDAAEPEVVVELLCRLPGPNTPFFKDRGPLLDGYTLPIDQIVFKTYRRAKEAVLAREKDMPETIRLGLAFVRRRLGEPISEANSAAIFQQIVKYQAKGYGLSSNHNLPILVDGALVENRLSDAAAVRRLAAMFGPDEQWAPLLLESALLGQWYSASGVLDAFLVASPAELARLVNRSSLDTGGTLKALAKVIPLRADTGQALWGAAQLVTENSTMSEMLRMGAIFAAGREGEPPPAGLDHQLTFELLDTPYEGIRETCSEWFRSFPRERALASAKKLSQEEFAGSRGVGILAVHYDEDLLRTFIENDASKGYLNAKTLGSIGKAALPLIEEAHEKASDDNKLRLHRATLIAMAAAAKQGGFDERFDRFIDFDKEGGQPLSYYDSDYSAVREAALSGIPEPRRSDLLLTRLVHTEHPDRILRVASIAENPAIVEGCVRKMVERRSLGDSVRAIVDRLGDAFVDALCRNIHLSGGDGRFLEALSSALSYPAYQRVAAALEAAGVKKETPKEALIRMVNEAPGPKTRIYLLQVSREGYEPKPGSLSVSGGKSPGTGPESIPRDAKGEPKEHLFSLDLDEIPELKERYPGARVLSCYCPEPRSGDRSEELVLVPVSAEAATAASSAEPDDAATPIAVLPLDVPLVVFDTTSEAPYSDIRNMVFNACGHVFGQPFWIQSDEGDDGFLMQINGGLADINLGDSGSLYVFDSGTIFQCY